MKKKNGVKTIQTAGYNGARTVLTNVAQGYSLAMAHTIDCVLSKMLNHGLNQGLLFSLEKSGEKTF